MGGPLCVSGVAIFPCTQIGTGCSHALTPGRGSVVLVVLNPPSRLLRVPQAAGFWLHAGTLGPKRWPSAAAQLRLVQGCLGGALTIICPGLEGLHWQGPGLGVPAPAPASTSHLDAAPPSRQPRAHRAAVQRAAQELGVRRCPAQPLLQQQPELLRSIVY